MLFLKTIRGSQESEYWWILGLRAWGLSATQESRVQTCRGDGETMSGSRHSGSRRAEGSSAALPARLAHPGLTMSAPRASMSPAAAHGHGGSVTPGFLR